MKIDRIIIPDTKFDLEISYPLSNSVEIEITSRSLRGFSLRELIFAIKCAYINIYEEEERTATPETYHIKKNCDCKDINLQTRIETIPSDFSYECPICYEKNFKNIGKTSM